VVQSGSDIDDIKGFGFAYTTHYVGNMGPIGINPTTNTPYNVNTAGALQGSLAADGVLPFLPWVQASATPIPAPASITLGEVTDGTSNTLLLFEVSWQGLERHESSLRAWPRGYVWNSDATCSKNVANPMRTVKYNGGGNYNNISMGSNHSGGCNVAFADGAIRLLSRNIDLSRVLLPLASRQGGEVLLEF